MHSDDERLGRLLRALRRRTGQTQAELASAAAVPVRDLIAAEAGQIGRLKVDRVRRLLSAAGAQARLTAWWNGAAAERLLDDGHARLVERAMLVLAGREWQAQAEVTFSEYGDRGSIDIFAGRPAFRAVTVCEIKTAIGSLEETNRRLDVKERLAPKLALARFGWRPAYVGRLLILPEDRTIRRLIARHAATMDSFYPARSREVRAWLHQPDRSLRAIWFLSDLRTTTSIPR